MFIQIKLHHNDKSSFSFDEDNIVWDLRCNSLLCSRLNKPIFLRNILENLFLTLMPLLTNDCSLIFIHTRIDLSRYRFLLQSLLILLILRTIFFIVMIHLYYFYPKNLKHLTNFIDSCIELYCLFHFVHNFKANFYLSLINQQLHINFRLLILSMHHYFRHIFLWRLCIVIYKFINNSTQLEFIICIVLKKIVRKF